MCENKMYKTEMCRNFEESGVCKYSDRCQFAHSLNELRDVERHPRYKTEICKNFLENRFCKYGKRCCFVHVGEQRDDVASALCVRSDFAMEIVFGSIWDDRDDAPGADAREKGDASPAINKTPLGNSLGSNHALVWTKNPVFYIEDKHKKYYESSAQHRAPGEPVLPVCE